MEFLHVFAMPSAWAALLTLAFMEIVMGIDNIVFLSISTSRLPEKLQPRARVVGMTLATLLRIGLLFCVSLLMQLNEPIFTFDTSWLDGGISVQSIIVFAGGLFLLYKSVGEVHRKLEGKTEKHSGKKQNTGFWSVIVQVVALDAVFSFDSVLTAVGMVSFRDFGYEGAMTLMIIAIVIAVGVMLWFSGPISRFVNKHPTIQMLALSFLILISVMLIVEAAHLSQLSIFGTTVGEIPKGYIYFAIGFSLMVEIFNMKMSSRSRRKPVKLRDSQIIEAKKE